jgi:hypothetical protein
MGSTPGTQTVYAWFRDGAGNYSVAANSSDTILYDITPPSGTITAAPSPNAGTVTIYCNSTGSSFMMFSNNGSTWTGLISYAASYAGWSLTSATYGGSTTNGTRTIYAKFRDSAGNDSAVTTTTVVLDTTAPASTITIGAGASWSTAATVTLTLTATDAIYAAGSLQMRLSNDGATWSGWETYAASRSWDMTSATYGGTTTNGTKYVYVQVKDPLGNTTTQWDAIGFDNVAPAASVTTPVWYMNAGATYTNSPLVTLNVVNGWTDATSGLSQMRFSNNASAYSAWETYAATRANWDFTSATYGGATTTGYKYVYAQVRDTAGNISSYTYDYIYYDTALPTGTVTIGSGDPASTSSTYVTLYFSASDTTGVTQRRLSNDNATWTAWEAYTSARAWWLLPDNGTKYVYVQFKDGAGNVSATYYDAITLAESYATLGGQDLWGTYPSPTNAAALAFMSTASISGSDPFASSPLAPGSVLTFYTYGGLYGKMEIVSFNVLEMDGLVIHTNVLTFNLVVYEADGVTVHLSATGEKVWGTYAFDLDTGTQTTSGADFWWSITSSTVRQLVPQNGARFDKWK